MLRVLLGVKIIMSLALDAVVDGTLITLSLVFGIPLLLWALFILKPKSFNNPFLKYGYWPFVLVVLLTGVQYLPNIAHALKRLPTAQYLRAEVHESPDLQPLETTLEAWVNAHSQESCNQEPLKSSADPVDRFYCNQLKSSE